MNPLLAKKFWRLLKEPNLLNSRVMEKRYNPHQELLKVKQKGTYSWLWKSWLGAKEVLMNELRRNVTDGNPLKSGKINRFRIL